MLNFTSAPLSTISSSGVKFNWDISAKEIFYSPVAATILALLFGSGLIWWLCEKIFKLGALHKDFEIIKEIVNTLKNKFDNLSSFIMAKSGVTALELYGQSASPIVLKQEYKKIVEDSGLAKQIKDNIETLCNLVKQKNPETSLDAQDKIVDLIVKGEMTKNLDLKIFKQILYEKGAPSNAIVPILTLYLSELIIPKLGFGLPDKPPKIK